MRHHSFRNICIAKTGGMSGALEAEMQRIPMLISDQAAEQHTR